MDYLAAPVVILFYVVGFLWKRKTWIPLSQIDVDSGRREVDMVLHEAKRARLAAMNPFRRFMDKIM